MRYIRCLYLSVLVALIASIGTPLVHAQDMSDAPCLEATSDSTLTPAQWAAFRNNLVEALHSDNEGCKAGALRQIIRYGAYLDFDRMTVFDVMRIYRDNQDARMRRLAVLALGQMNDRWAIEFLSMAVPYEKSSEIRTTMENVIAEYRSAHALTSSGVDTR